MGNAADFCLVVKAIIVLFGLYYYYDTYCYYTIRGARNGYYYETLLGTIIACDIIVVTTSCARDLRRDVYIGHRIANSGA